MSELKEWAATNVIARSETQHVLSVDLVVIEGPDRGKRLRLRATARVGTAPNCELCLSDRTVSRVHCDITARPDRIVLRDRGSTNGTYLAGQRVRDADLGPGALIHIGNTAFRVEPSDEPGHLELSSSAAFGGLLGRSIEMRRLYAILERAAPTDATVLIGGETGTGKELTARAIHDRSLRRAGPFVAVDCGSMPENLIESELFGHVRGSYTGATGDRPSVFEDAEGGTLFFDEIGELPLALQPKLLRVLETRQIRRVGSNTTRPVNVRILAATNRPLARSINEGTFREDLYYRLAVVEVELPPLRHRREDISMIAEHFIERFSGQKTPPPPELLSQLLARAWPGNVRELRNFIERAVSLQQLERPRTGHPPELAPELDALIPTHLPFKEAREQWNEQFELAYVRALLKKSGNNVTRAADAAGVSRRFLQRILARLGKEHLEDDS